jgi:hypothetical protein
LDHVATEHLSKRAITTFVKIYPEKSRKEVPSLQPGEKMHLHFSAVLHLLWEKCDESQNMPSQNMPLWSVAYFEQQAVGKHHMQKGLSDLPVST